MNALDLPINQQYRNEKPIIITTSWMKTIATDLYNTASAPIAVTRDTLSERLYSVCETASLLLENKARQEEGETEKKKKQIEENVDLTLRSRNGH